MSEQFKMKSMGAWEADDFPILKISGSKYPRLLAAISLTHDHKTVGYYCDKDEMVFFWTDHPKCTKFPGNPSDEMIADWIEMWLKGTAEYVSEPDHDGSNSKGWLISTDSWGHVDGYGYQAHFRVKPHWIMHGK